MCSESYHMFYFSGAHAALTKTIFKRNSRFKGYHNNQTRRAYKALRGAFLLPPAILFLRNFPYVSWVHLSCLTASHIEACLHATPPMPRCRECISIEQRLHCKPQTACKFWFPGKLCKNLSTKFIGCEYLLHSAYQDCAILEVKECR